MATGGVWIPVRERPIIFTGRKPSQSAYAATLCGPAYAAVTSTLSFTSSQPGSPGGGVPRSVSRTEFEPGASPAPVIEQVNSVGALAAKTAADRPVGFK